MLSSYIPADSAGCGCCGTNTDSNSPAFRNSKSNLAYIDKVFSYKEGHSCPISYSLNTATSEIPAQLITSKEPLPPVDPCAQKCCCDSPAPDCSRQCCCCCGGTSDCQTGTASVFTVKRSFAVVNSLTPAAAIAPAGVTLNGHAVNAVNTENGIYTVDISNIENQLSDAKCQCSGLPSKAFFMINGITGWNLTGQLILDGTVNTGGSVCNFRATFNITAPLAVTGTTAFAISDAGIPCSVHGISPAIQFTLGGRINILNPEITITAAGTQLTALLILEPSINLEVTRKTLMCMTGCEADIPCDNSLTSALIQQGGCAEEPGCMCSAKVPEPPVAGCEKPSNECEKPQENECGCSMYQFNGTNGCSCGY